MAARYDREAEAKVRAFARSYSKLLKKRVPCLELAESVLRARLFGANARSFAALLPAGFSPEAAQKIAEDPADFDRSLTRLEAKLRRLRRPDGDLTGLPSWTLRRRARRRQPLSADEARVLDESPFGSRVLRNAQRAGVPIESLREANFAALPEIVRDASQHELERGAEQFLVELVHRTTGKWYFADLANLLHADAKALENRSRDFRIRPPRLPSAPG